MIVFAYFFEKMDMLHNEINRKKKAEEVTPEVSPMFIFCLFTP